MTGGDDNFVKLRHNNKNLSGHYLNDDTEFLLWKFKHNIVKFSLKPWHDVVNNCVLTTVVVIV